MVFLHVYRAACNLLNEGAGAVRCEVHGPRPIVMPPISLLAIGARLGHGGLAGAIRSDRLLRSPRLAPTSDVGMTTRRIQP
jgi:hypothetical protein